MFSCGRSVCFYFYQGSYGRLGLGDSANQPQLKRVGIPTDCGVKQVSSSKGSDGHTLAVTVDGQVYSWGDGKFISYLLPQFVYMYI